MISSTNHWNSMYSSYASPRFTHSILSLVIFGPLLINAFTGSLYQILLLFFGMDRTKIRWLISVHQMSFLGEFIKAVYTPTIALLVVYQVVSGLYMMTSKFTRVPAVRPIANSLYNLHHNAAIYCGIPLLHVAVTGGFYRFLRSVVGMDAAKVQWLMTLHKLEFMGLQYIYPILAACCVIVIVGLGAPLNAINQGQFESSIKKENRDEIPI